MDMTQADSVVYTSETESTDKTNSPSKFSNSTYSIISKVAYLIGVPVKIFENEHEPPKMEQYEELSKNKNARIIRNLCMLRTAIELNFSKLNKEIHYNLKNLHSFPELIPQECIKQLSDDGISIIKANRKLNDYIIDINGHIANRINNCKDIFPIWLKWDYIRDLFIMPNGAKESGIKTAANEYYANKSRYPYQVYINWYSNCGNILYNDKKFATALYEAHEDRFDDISKVSDASDHAKESIYDFLSNSQRTVIMVDCENSDAVKLYATLNNLNQKTLLGKIYKIILCDDHHTTNLWDRIEQFTDIPVEHKEIARITDRKSIVDQALCVIACQEHFQNQVDSIILFGSDSDYWGLYGLLKTVKYFVMVESGKFGTDNKNALIEADIPYCYIDNFCTGNSYQFKLNAMVQEVNRVLDEALHLNVHDMLREVYNITRIDMTEAEQKQFYNRYIKQMKLVIDDNGDVYIALGQ